MEDKDSLVWDKTLVIIGRFDFKEWRVLVLGNSDFGSENESGREFEFSDPNM